MARRVKDHIDISECTSLGDLIRYLEAIRDNLPEGHEAEMRIRGEEDSGRRLTITYFRDHNSDETALEFKRPAEDPGSDAAGADLEHLRRQLDDVAFRAALTGQRRDASAD